MPAHYTHSFFVFEALSQINRSDLFQQQLTPWFILGAQGPDMFYHGLRTKPSSIALGSLLHRHSYGSFSANLLSQCVSGDHGPASPLGAYTLGFISHGILDRYLHPFINYFSGWQEQGNPESEQFRYAHSFYERIIDLEVTQLPGWKQLQTIWGLIAPGSQMNFNHSIDLGTTIPPILLDHLQQALLSTYPKLAKDSLLSQRIQNSYLDTLGFYRYCDWWIQNQANQSTADSSSLNHDSVRWLSLVHPQALPSDQDFLNLKHEIWIDPCGLGEETSQDLWALYDLAMDRLTSIYEQLLDLWEQGIVASDFPGIAPLIGDSDLRNTYEDVMLCKLTVAKPKHIRRILEQLATGIIPDHWNRFY